MTGAYQVSCTACSFLVGSFAFWTWMDVSILNVSKVPALVVVLSCPITFDVPVRFQLTPAVLFKSVPLNDQLLPAVSGARIPVPSLGVYRQMPLFVRFQERSKFR